MLESLMLVELTDGAEDAPKEFKPLRDRLLEVMRSHGIDPERVSEEFEAAGREAYRADVGLSEQKTRELLLGHLTGDRKKFYGDARGVIAELQRLIAVEYRKALAAETEAQDAGEAGATERKPEVQVLGVKVSGDRAVMAVQRRLPESSVLMHGSLRIRHATETQYFRRIGGRWFLASESNEPVHAPLHEVKESSLPYSRTFQMDCGDALRFELSDGKEVAVWCSGTPVIGQAFGQGALAISWGEKPFRSSPLKYRKMPDGGRVVEGDDSYIRMGGVTTSSNRPAWFQRDLYVGKYRILLDENRGEEGKLALTVRVRLATLSESLHGDARREHYVRQLESDSAAKQMEAFEELREMIGLGSMYAGEPGKMADVIRPLLEDSNAAVSKAAFDTLCSLGDEQTLLNLMTPAPKEPFRSIDGGSRIAEWNLKQKHDSVIRRVATFFDSKGPELVAFAVGFFARDANPIAKKQMLAAVDHESAKIRAEALGSLRFYCEAPEAARLLATRLDDKEEKVVLEALRAANWLNQHIKANKITPNLKHPNPDVREMACYALSGCRDPEAVVPLLEATRDEEPRVRGTAAVTLGRIGAPNSVDRLIEMLQDPAADVRADAINGLRWLDTPKANPAIKHLLETEKNDRVRRMGEQTLREM
ncbi:MAG: HEAT repeat domain-containing protein [Planctomycetes bacterium]|nr:HEAT repeat domain-containing protein [Planctomycetota bacterium]